MAKLSISAIEDGFSMFQAGVHRRARRAARVASHPVSCSASPRSRSPAQPWGTPSEGRSTVSATDPPTAASRSSSTQGPDPLQPTQPAGGAVSSPADLAMTAWAHNPTVVAGSNPAPAITRALKGQTLKRPSCLRLRVEPSSVSFLVKPRYCSCSRFGNNWEQIVENRALSLVGSAARANRRSDIQATRVEAWHIIAG